MTTQVPPMSRGEREDLQRLVRQREKVLKSAARQRSADLIADFENQMGQEYSFDQDTVWEQAVKSVEPLVAKAQAQIADRCRELGIPRQFAPGVDLAWHHRGYGNLLAARRVELRRMATTQIAAIERKAIVEIEMSCLETQTQIAAAGLTRARSRTCGNQRKALGDSRDRRVLGDHIGILRCGNQWSDHGCRHLSAEHLEAVRGKALTKPGGARDT